MLQPRRALLSSFGQVCHRVGKRGGNGRSSDPHPGRDHDLPVVPRDPSDTEGTADPDDRVGLGECHRILRVVGEQAQQPSNPLAQPLGDIVREPGQVELADLAELLEVGNGIGVAERAP